MEHLFNGVKHFSRNDFEKNRELFRRIAISYRICRIYALDNCHNAELASALDRLTRAGTTDDATNM